jgi:hypothetical protein
MTLAVDNTMETIQYWDAQREALGFETVWSMWEFADINQNIFKEGVKRVCYTFYAQDATVGELMNDTAQQIEVSAFAASGSVRDLWAAAESCFQQAKQQGDWHKFIEDFELRDDGSYEIVMGS